MCEVENTDERERVLKVSMVRSQGGRITRRALVVPRTETKRKKKVEFADGGRQEHVTAMTHEQSRSGRHSLWGSRTRDASKPKCPVWSSRPRLPETPQTCLFYTQGSGDPAWSWSTVNQVLTDNFGLEIPVGRTLTSHIQREPQCHNSR